MIFVLPQLLAKQQTPEKQYLANLVAGIQYKPSRGLLVVSLGEARKKRYDAAL